MASFITGDKAWLCAVGLELGWERFCLSEPCSFTGLCLRVHSAVLPVMGDGSCTGAISLNGQEEMCRVGFHSYILQVFIFFRNFPKV